MSYSDERVDLTSNKMSVKWKTRTGIEANAWEELLKYADHLILPWTNQMIPDLNDENLNIEEWEYEIIFCKTNT